jgi:hypothetical protein
MNKTIYYCDVCEKETEQDSLYKVAMAIHKDLKTPISVYIDTCEDCVKETGFNPNHGNSYNNNLSVEKGHKNWFKWFKKSYKLIRISKINRNS